MEGAANKCWKFTLIIGSISILVLTFKKEPPLASIAKYCPEGVGLYFYQNYNTSSFKKKKKKKLSLKPKNHPLPLRHKAAISPA